MRFGINDKAMGSHLHLYRTPAQTVWSPQVQPKHTVEATESRRDLP